MTAERNDVYLEKPDQNAMAMEYESDYRWTFRHDAEFLVYIWIGEEINHLDELAPVLRESNGDFPNLSWQSDS